MIKVRHQRKRRGIPAEKDGHVLLSVSQVLLCRFHDIGILGRQVWHQHQLNPARILTLRAHLFIFPLHIGLHEAFRRPDNIDIAPVVDSHLQFLPGRIAALEFKHFRGNRAPERIDALIIVAHHKQVPAFAHKKRHNFMLEHGGVLCLIQAHIGELFLVPLQDIRILLEALIRPLQHIVKIHEIFPVQIVLVRRVNGLNGALLFAHDIVDFPDLCRRQHPVLDEPDQRRQRIDDHVGFLIKRLRVHDLSEDAFLRDVLSLPGLPRLLQRDPPEPLRFPGLLR